MVEFADFNQAKGPPMTDNRLALADRLQKAGDGDFLRTVAESVLQLIMQADVHAQLHNHFALGCQLVDRQTYRARRSAALAEWQIVMG